MEDFLIFQQYKDGHHMIQVAQDMPSVSYCIYAETLPGWILCLAVLLKLSDRTGESILYKSHRGFCQLFNGVAISISD